MSTSNNDTPDYGSFLDLPAFTSLDPGAVPGLPAPQPTGPAAHLLAAAGTSAPTRRSQTPQTPRQTTPAVAPGDDEPKIAEQVDWALLRTLRSEVAELLQRSLTDRPGMSEADQRAIAQTHALDVIKDRMAMITAEDGDRAVWSQELQHRMAKAIIDGLYGLGRFQPLVDDSRVENIDIYGCDSVWVKYAGGKKVKVAPITPTDEDLVEEIRMIATLQGESARPWSSAHPILSMDLPGGIGRLEATHPPISKRPKIVMRIHRFVDITLDDLVELGSLTPDMAELLKALVRGGRSGVVAGHPAAGKTTLLRGLSNEIDPLEEIITIEKERELHLDLMGDRHLIVTPLQYRPGLGERAADGSQPGEITLVNLLESALRLDAQRIIVGEVRGGEVDAMFQAMQAGMGSLSTLHAASASDAIERLADLALKSQSNASTEYAYRQIARHIDFIIQVAKVRRPDGTVKRMVTEIAQVGTVEGHPVAHPLFALNKAGQQVLVGRPTQGMDEVLYEAGLSRDFFRNIQETAA